MDKKIGLCFELNLQLFAQSGGEKTEKATPRKRAEARKRGQVLQSREINAAVVLIFAFFSLKVFGNFIYRETSFFAIRIFREYSNIDNLFTANNLSRLFIDTTGVVLKSIAPVFAVVLVGGLGINYAQVGYVFTTDALAFKFSRINPINGMKRVFSLHGIAELVKAVAKITVISYVAYSYLKKEIPGILNIMDMDITGVAVYTINITINVALRICFALIFLALADYGYQWWEYERNLRMTKQEVKEEFKQTEGNPQTKSRIRQQQRQMSMKRMISEVPKADVIITNPTHFAVAIKYDAEVSEAPVVVAKGMDFIAIRIKDIARENSIEIVENKPLARTLYDTVDVGEKIPPELYQAVAEILAFVYNLKE